MSKVEVMKFKSYEEYEAWTETFDECYEYQYIPCIIDDGWKISADLFTDCKSWKIALNRFKKYFPEVAEWVDCMRESAENGYFKNVDGCKPAWTNDIKEIKEFLKNGAYSWGIEETMDGTWYIFLNVSGTYR